MTGISLLSNNYLLMTLKKIGVGQKKIHSYLHEFLDELFNDNWTKKKTMQCENEIAGETQHDKNNYVHCKRTKQTMYRDKFHYYQMYHNSSKVLLLLARLYVRAHQPLRKRGYF